MTKKLWIMLLTLMLCLGALCAETGAKAVGASETQQPSSAAKVEYAFGRGTAVRYLDTLEEAFRWIYNTSGTITLLKDVEISTPLQITPGNVWDGTVLDLGGKTLTANIPETESLAGSAVINVNTATVNRFTIQNGTIKNLSNGIGLYLADGKITLKDLTVENDVVIQNQWLYLSKTPPQFFSGRFSKIRLDTNGSILLSRILGEGSYVMKDGVRLDKAQQYASLEDITFMPCDHKDNGAYTLSEDAQTEYHAPAKQCSVCGNFCTHDEITADSKCTACGLPILIKATNLANGKAIGPLYYTGLDDAMNEILHVHAGRRPVL